MVKLATHNSWSYAKPLKWYIPHFIARCQAVPIQEQYHLGARLFDLRLRLCKEQWWAAHGPCIFNVNYHKDLTWLNCQKNVYVRILLEYNSEPKNADSIIEDFQEECHNLVIQYPNIKFFGGLCKWDWRLAYRFITHPPIFLDSYSSTTSLFDSDNTFLKIIDDWWPWLYARLNNQKNYNKFIENNNDEYLMVDFINIINQ